MAPAPSDETIRRMAKARVEFRQHAVVYLLVNLLLLGIWFFYTGPETPYWPVWTHLGWGIGLAFHGFHAYGGANRGDAIEREEAKLREKYGRA